MTPSAPTGETPLLDPLNTLYPIACLMVGPDDAPDLILRTYRRATEHPPSERPDDLERWLLDLLKDVAQTAATDRNEAPSPPDAVRQEVAEQLLDAALPIALATCPLEERVHLVVDAVQAPEEDSAPPLHSSSDKDNAVSPLWDTLRTALSDAEYALIDTTFSDADLRAAARAWVTDRFGPVPTGLQARVQTTLEAAQPKTKETSPASEAPSASPSSGERGKASSSRTFTRALAGILLLVGGIGAAYLFQPSASSPSSSANTGLVAFSASHAESVASKQTTSTRADAEAYIGSTWNRSVRVPTIAGAPLQGVGQMPVEGGPDVPVLLYSDSTTDARIAAFVYSYALVDQIKGTATLNTQVRSKLSRPDEPVVQTEDASKALLWRTRDDIFVVVSPTLPADSLRPRIRP